ncbi:MAG TPA: VOC family protein, partial [Candidatus Limnocylindrales bacterium]
FPGGRTLGAAKIVHVEATGKNGAALQKFYSEAFDWKLDTSNPGGYGMHRDDNGMTAGVGATQDGSDGAVTFYVHVEDAAATLKHIEALGGTIVMPLTEVAPETTIALFADPAGHVVGLM